MTDFTIKIEVRSYSSATGQQIKERETAKPRHRSFQVDAIDFRDAYSKARAIEAGINSDDAVWTTNLRAVIETDYKPQGC